MSTNEDNLATKATPLEMQRDKLKRKETVILAAARSIFVDHGLGGARMSQIAQRAGVGEGTIYSYYANKSELMLAVLAQFWSELTKEAAEAMVLLRDTGFLEQLTALGTYHLDALVENADFINLTSALRRNNSEVSVSPDHLRAYVAIFDQIVQRGIDRGELREDLILWQARDLFYGTLEHSARSIAVTFVEDRTVRQQAPVVDNLIELFGAHYGTVSKRPIDSGVIERLDRIEKKLNQMDR